MGLLSAITEWIGAKLQALKDYLIGLWQRQKWWIVGGTIAATVLGVIFWPVLSSGAAVLKTALRLVRTFCGILGRVFTRRRTVSTTYINPYTGGLA